jgi:phenylpropionate dioxygenase-like ring-hydroxylating dioxygenase large terminal subunit
MAIATRNQTPDSAPSALGAFSSVCPHMGGPLEQGQIENDEVTCPWHRYRFSLSTGEGRGVARLLGLCLSRQSSQARP